MWVGDALDTLFIRFFFFLRVVNLQQPIPTPSKSYWKYWVDGDRVRRIKFLCESVCVASSLKWKDLHVVKCSFSFIQIPSDLLDKEFLPILQEEPLPPLALVPFTEEEQVCIFFF